MGESVRLEVAVAAAPLERIEHLDDLASSDCVVVHGAQARRAVPAAPDSLTRAFGAVVAQQRDRDDRERRCRSNRG
jgi:hypothetical protein